MDIAKGNPTGIMLDQLERRRLMAASASMVHGMVAVRGTSGADEVHMSVSADIRRSDNRITRDELNIEINNRAFTFPAGAVRSITMRLGAGNDVLHGSGELSRYVTKSGERTLTRADWKLEVHGGAGNDLLVGSNGSETLRGGAGDDSISGGLGDDSTYGDEGNDLLSEHDGVDRMDGGGGDDVLVMVWPGSPVGKRYPKAYGGSGSDQIFLPEVSKSYFGTRIEAVHRVDFHSGFKPDLNMGWVPA